MRVFISWAADNRSRIVANVLRDWLPELIQSVKPWVSTSDIAAGARWSLDIAKELSETKVGIICVTPENQHAPWLSFEAGALTKTLSDSFVCPYLIQMTAEDLLPGPLTQFQTKPANREGTFDLVSMINDACESNGLTKDRLQRGFERMWPELAEKMSSLPAVAEPVPRAQPEILAEVLNLVRSLARRVPETPLTPVVTRRVRRQNQEHVLGYTLTRLFGQAALVPIQGELRMMTDTELDDLEALVGHGPIDEKIRQLGLGGLLSVVREPKNLSPMAPPEPPIDSQNSP